MSDYLDNLRFDTEKGIAEALLFLMSRGVGEDNLVETLVQCGPVDLDVLAMVMRAFSPENDGLNGDAANEGHANAA